MATLNTNLTGPELHYGVDPNTKNLWGYGWKRGYNDPWRDQKRNRFLGNVLANILLPGSGAVLGAAQKFEGLLDPHGWNRPFHKSEETMEKERQADIASRDDSPIIAKERRKLWALYKRLERPADLAALKRHIRVFG
jgi:hypothetical protein